MYLILHFLQPVIIWIAHFHTDRVDTLIEKLSDRKKQLIVTTRQKIQILLRKSEKENNKKFDKMRKLKVAFVVDECHRTVTPKTKRKIEHFL